MREGSFYCSSTAIHINIFISRDGSLESVGKSETDDGGWTGKHKRRNGMCSIPRLNDKKPTNVGYTTGCT